MPVINCFITVFCSPQNIHYKTIFRRKMCLIQVCKLSNIIHVTRGYKHSFCYESFYVPRCILISSIYLHLSHLFLRYAGVCVCLCVFVPVVDVFSKLVLEHRSIICTCVAPVVRKKYCFRVVFCRHINIKKIF